MIVFSLGEVLALLLLVALVLHAFSAVRVRELALEAVQRAARAGQFQLLDQSVHLRRISLSRDQQGRWRIWRQYRFDYSLDGADRHQGHVIMLGNQFQGLLVGEHGPQQGSWH